MTRNQSAYLCQASPQDTTRLYVFFPRKIAEVLKSNPDQRYRVLHYINGLADTGRAYCCCMMPIPNIFVRFSTVMEDPRLIPLTNLLV